ncbi:MAG: hypothetical protein ABIP55_12275, partial [Tepidisphaeraceae bacterium]
MTQPASPGIPPTPTSAAGMGAPAAGIGAMDKEIVYFEGRPTLRADQAKAMMWLLAGLVLISLPVIARIYEWGWPWWVTLACVAAAVVIVVV